MKALVMGGTGFIGSHIVNYLISNGIQVRVLARRSSDVSQLNQKKIELVYGNIFEIDSFRDFTRDVDLVYSAFGILGGWGIPEKTYWDINVQAVKNLMASCVDRNIKQFIHISSAGVLGPLPDGIEADETFPYNPSNVYERTKCEAEKEILKFCRKKKLPYTIIRPEFVYGPGDTHVLGLFRAIKAKRFVLLGKGKSCLHPTYIDDLIQGIHLCTNNKNAIDNVFLITGNHAISVRELTHTIAVELEVSLPEIRIPLFFARMAAAVLEPIAGVLKFEPMLTKSRVNFFTENRAFSFQKAQKELGFSPNVDFGEGVSKTISWYKEKGYL